MGDDKPKQELSFFEQIGHELAPMSEEEKKQLAEFQQEGMKEEGKGLPLIAPRIDILHQGAQAFKFREAPEEEQIKKSFNAIIIHVDPQRAWWETAIGESKEGATSGQVPDCYSRDLIKPDPACGKPQSNTTCEACQWNQFGSDRKGGRGKDCKEMRRIFVMVEGKLDPHVMTVPPTSLKAMRSYLTFLQEHKIPRPQFALTKFSLKATENKEGTTYSELSMTFLKRLDDKVALMALQSKKAIEGMLEHASPVTRADYQPEPGSQG